MNSILHEHAPLKLINNYKIKFKSKLWKPLSFRNQLLSKTIY